MIHFDRIYTIIKVLRLKYDVWSCVKFQLQGQVLIKGPVRRYQCSYMITQGTYIQDRLACSLFFSFSKCCMHKHRDCSISAPMTYYREVSMFCISATRYTYSYKHIWSHFIASSNEIISIAYEKEKNQLHANLPCIYVP